MQKSDDNVTVHAYKTNYFGWRYYYETLNATLIEICHWRGLFNCKTTLFDKIKIVTLFSWTHHQGCVVLTFKGMECLYTVKQPNTTHPCLLPNINPQHVFTEIGGKMIPRLKKTSIKRLAFWVFSWQFSYYYNVCYMYYYHEDLVLTKYFHK